MGLKVRYKPMGLKVSYKPMGLKVRYKRMGLKVSYKPMGLKVRYKPSGLKVGKIMCKTNTVQIAITASVIRKAKIPWWMVSWRYVQATAKKVPVHAIVDELMI